MTFKGPNLQKHLNIANEFMDVFLNSVCLKEPRHIIVQSPCHISGN